MIVDRHGIAIQVARWVDSPTTLAMGVVSNRAGALKANTIYRLWASADCFFRWGDAAVNAATTDHPLKAGQDILHVTDDPNVYCAAIVAAGSGVLFISELDTL